jgi:restriction system protein
MDFFQIRPSWTLGNELKNLEPVREEVERLRSEKESARERLYTKLFWAIVGVGLVYAAAVNPEAGEQPLTLGQRIGSFMLAEIVMFVLLAVPGRAIIESHMERKYSPDEATLKKHERYLYLVKKHKKEEMRREEQDREKWLALSPREFEVAVREFFDVRADSASLTRYSKDDGVDIIVYNGLKKFIVQCKHYRKCIGPGPIREIYGIMLDHQADGAIVVCSGGFSRGALEFATKRPITLLDLDDLTRKGDSLEEILARVKTMTGRELDAWRDLQKAIRRHTS